MTRRYGLREEQRARGEHLLPGRVGHTSSCGLVVPETDRGSSEDARQPVCAAATPRAWDRPPLLYHGTSSACPDPYGTIG